MKRQLAVILFVGLFAAYVFSSTFIVSGCGGGGGGGGGFLPLTTAPLGTGTFIKTPDLTDDLVSDVLPFPNNTMRLQVLYPASEINGSGYIEELRLFYSSGSPTDTICPNMTVRLGHTNVSSLSTTFSANYEQGQGSLVTVINDAFFVIPAGAAGDEISIPLETAFNYNGKDNLIVEFIHNTACSQTLLTKRDSGLGAVRRVYDWPLDGTPDTAFGSQNLANLIKFVFTGGDNAVPSTPGTAVTHTFPFTLNATIGRKAQMLYTAAEIDGSGPVTGIAFMLNAVSTAEEYTYTVKMGHATISDFVGNTTFADNFSDTPVTLANNVVFKVPAGIPAGEYFWLSLPDGVFNYNGTDNLIVEIETTATTGNIALRAYNDILADTKLAGDLGSTTGSTWDMYHPVKFRFNGGTMDVITDGGSSYIIPVSSSMNEFIIQILYDNTALGTGGQITSMGFRLGSDANAFDHTDVNLVLGHTTLSTLGIASLAANIESDRTAAFSGTISIPAGLKAGDWVIIPLATQFTYDPTKNLVVQWDAPAFGTTNPSIGHTMLTGRYAGHVEGNIGDRTSDVSNLVGGDFVLDMSLNLNK